MVTIGRRIHTGVTSLWEKTVQFALKLSKAFMSNNLKQTVTTAHSVRICLRCTATDGALCSMLGNLMGRRVSFSASAYMNKSLAIDLPVFRRIQELQV